MPASVRADSAPSKTFAEVLGAGRSERPAARLDALVRRGLGRLPWPGGGHTLERWQALARVGGEDLSLAKLFEGHTDALAIRHELGAPPPLVDSTWGTWCAEGPAARVELRERDGKVTLHGRKSWCSGAADVSHALLTVWRGKNGPFLAGVDLHQPGVTVSESGWNAVGMRASASVDVTFDGATAELVGDEGGYLSRPGFWQGGIGVAACWYGAAVTLGETLATRMSDRPEPHGLAHLGAVDVSLSSSRALLVAAAQSIDDHPRADAQILALRVRAGVEETVECVLRHVGRALGAAPFCKDVRFANLAADLPVFVRQSHAEQDLAALGEAVAVDSPHWAL